MGGGQPPAQAVFSMEDLEFGVAHGSPSRVCWPHVERLPVMALKAQSPGFEFLTCLYIGFSYL